MIAGFKLRTLEEITPDRSANCYPILADEELLTLVEGGDHGAFACLYDRHAGAAFALAYRRTGEREAAEDLVQDAFLRVWASADSYKAVRGSVRTWVLSIVHNLAVDRYRYAMSRRRTRERLEAVTATYQPSEAFAEAWRNLRRDRVREALEALPPEQLEVLELSYYSGHTHAEIAELLGLSLGTVKSRLRLGLKKLRNHFEARDVALAG